MERSLVTKMYGGLFRNELSPKIRIVRNCSMKCFFGWLLIIELLTVCSTHSQVPVLPSRAALQKPRSALAAQPKTFRIQWDANAELDITNYNVYWGLSPTQTTNGITAGNNLFLTLSYSAFSPGTNWFAVTAVNARGLESDRSLAIPIVVARSSNSLPRINLTLTWKPDTQLHWDANPETNITNYVVYWGPSKTQITNQATVGTNLTFLPTNCPEGTNWFAVTAVNSLGLESDPSTVVSATIFNKWNIYDVSTLKTNQTKWVGTVTQRVFVVSSLSGYRFFMVKATNQFGQQSRWLKLAYQ